MLSNVNLFPSVTSVGCIGRYFENSKKNSNIWNVFNDNFAIYLSVSNSLYLVVSHTTRQEQDEVEKERLAHQSHSVRLNANMTIIFCCCCKRIQASLSGLCGFNIKQLKVTGKVVVEELKGRYLREDLLKTHMHIWNHQIIGKLKTRHPKQILSKQKHHNKRISCN